MAYNCSSYRMSDREKCRRLLLQGLFDPAILLPPLNNMGNSCCWCTCALASSWPVSGGALSTSVGPYHIVVAAMTALNTRLIQLRHGCSV